MKKLKSRDMKREELTVTVAQICLLRETNVSGDFVTRYHLGRALRNLFLGFVYRSTAAAHRSPVLP